MKGCWSRTVEVMAALLYPAPSFHFTVSFAGAMDGPDSAFMEVDGLETELGVEEVIEGGENRFVHRLPTRTRGPEIILRRGVTAAGSALRRWCLETLEGGLGRRLEPRVLEVMLLDEDAEPLVAWSIVDAYPRRIAVGALDAMTSAVAVETIELVAARIVRRDARGAGAAS